ncbi:protein CFAP20DC isoform X1 [Nematostella vectensis]|uniref:protein CFAP20DC isoform X1 n=1 Tax=Nematostella vectensis TaxID=45351 RepID=UPI0020776B79|nr:protein CFAP20DC isoform X1 [Nematostella vectensis]
MFKNEFQGGPFVEVFSAQGRDPVSKWRLCGNASTAKKIFDRDVKSYVFILEGESTTTKMSIPKDEKQSLFLIQKYLILQLFVPLGHSFSFELGITDMGNNKRRIFMSSSHREVTVTPLHARFPLSILRLGVWLNLCLDLNSLVGETFKGQAFKVLESLTVSANCHLRKIFTMKTQPPDTTDDDNLYGSHTNSGEVEAIPKAMQFTTIPDLQHYTQVINITKLRLADLHAREVAGLPPPSTPTISEMDSTKQEERQTHIAFGSRVAIPKHARKPSREGSSVGRSSSNMLNRSSSVTQLRSSSPHDIDTARDKDHRIIPFQRSMSDASEIENVKSPLEVEAVPTAIQPRPPRTGSGNKSLRRPVRVRGGSGGKGGRGSRNMSTSDQPSSQENTSGYRQKKDSISEGSEKYEKDSDSCSESISRSQSESSLKASGNDSSLGESFKKLNINGQRQKPEKYGTSMSKQNAMFTFASKPRRAPRSPRARKNRKDDFVSSPVESKTNNLKSPNIVVTAGPDMKASECSPKQRGRKESERSEYEEDFYRASGESSEEEDLQKLLKTSSASRTSSRGSRRSPFDTPEPPQTPHVLRTSIKSSLLKEIPKASLPVKSYDSKAYQSTASSWRNYQSEAGSSWRFDTSDSSSSLLDQSLNSSIGDHVFHGDHHGSNGLGKPGRVIHVDGESSDDSDESCSTWKVPPPPSHRVHRYQDEMMHPGSEPDLSATLPMDPRAYTDVFSPPIIMPSEKLSDHGSQNFITSALSPSNSMNQNTQPRSHNHSISSDHSEHKDNELELDLLYDPCLNCYFDPKTNKYYELA